MQYMTPTERIFNSLQYAADFFNRELFNNQLPDVVLTIDSSKTALGSYSDSRWSDESGEFISQIALNSGPFASAPLISTLSVLVHEQVHQLQYLIGSPSRRGYHNKEWGQLMRDIGLEPDNFKGGDVGEKVGHTIVEDGPFLHACIKLIQEHKFTLPLFDRRVLYPGTIRITSKNNGPEVNEKEGHSSAPEKDKVKTALELNEIYKDLEAKSMEDAISLVRSTDATDDVIDLLTRPMTNATTHPEYYYTAASVKPLIPKPRRHGNRAKYVCKECNVHLLGKPGILVKCLKCDFLLFDEGMVESYEKLLDFHIPDNAINDADVSQIVFNSLLNAISLEDFIGFLDSMSPNLSEASSKAIAKACLSFTYGRAGDKSVQWYNIEGCK